MSLVSNLHVVSLVLLVCVIGVQCTSGLVSLVSNVQCTCSVTGVIGAKERQGRCRMLMRETCQLLLDADEDHHLGDACWLW